MKLIDFGFHRSLQVKLDQTLEGDFVTVRQRDTTNQTIQLL